MAGETFLPPSQHLPLMSGSVKMSGMQSGSGGRAMPAAAVPSPRRLPNPSFFNAVHPATDSGTMMMHHLDAAMASPSAVSMTDGLCYLPDQHEPGSGAAVAWNPAAAGSGLVPAAVLAHRKLPDIRQIGNSFVPEMQQQFTLRQQTSQRILPPNMSMNMPSPPSSHHHQHQFQVQQQHQQQAGRTGMTTTAGRLLPNQQMHSPSASHFASPSNHLANHHHADFQDLNLDASYTNLIVADSLSSFHSPSSSSSFVPQPQQQHNRFHRSHPQQAQPLLSQSKNIITGPALKSIRSQLRVTDSEEEEILHNEPEIEQVYLHQPNVNTQLTGFGDPEYWSFNRYGQDDDEALHATQHAVNHHPEDPGVRKHPLQDHNIQLKTKRQLQEDKVNDSKWLFDMDKGWVINPTAVPVSRKRELKSQANGQKMRRKASDEFELMADHPNKGLGAKLSAVLGGDVITVIGSKRRPAEKEEEDESDPPPPPAPDFPGDDRSRPGSASGLRRSSPVSPNRKPVVSRKTSSSPAKNAIHASKPSKKELWKNSTKTESMLWSTVDEELDEEEEEEEYAADEEGMFDQEVLLTGDATTAFPATGNLQPLKSNSIFPTTKKPQTSFQQPPQQPQFFEQQQQVQLQATTRKLPQVTGVKNKRTGLERQNEIVIPSDQTGRRGSFTLQVVDDQTSAGSRRGSFQVMQVPDMMSQVGVSSRRGSFNATADASSFAQVKVSSTLGLMSQGQQMLPSPVIDLRLMSQQQQQKGSMLPVVTISGPVFGDNERIVPPPIQERRLSSTINEMPPGAQPSSVSLTSLPPSSVSGFSQLQQQQQQVPPPSALRSEAKGPSEAKTVTFSDQLLQEHTFNPSNASSPFPQHDASNSTDLMFQRMDQARYDVDLPSKTTTGSTIMLMPTTTATAAAGTTGMSNGSVSVADAFNEQQQQQQQKQQQQQQQQTAFPQLIEQNLMLNGSQGVNGISANLLMTTGFKDHEQLQQPQVDVMQRRKSQDQSIVDIKSGSEGGEGDRTSGLRDFEPENVEGMTIARIRWLAAFNKIVSEMTDEVSLFLFYFSAFSIHSPCFLNSFFPPSCSISIFCLPRHGAVLSILVFNF